MDNNNNFEVKALLEVIIKGMQEKKAEKITIIDLRGLENSVCDYFVITNANSNTQVNAIADSIQKETLETLGDKAWHKEGTESSEWILMDYVNIVAHIFQTSVREFYALEDLWADAEITEIKASN
tara:strand:+ start:5236 stop:5610 length:375 start_codon:yes stop_codon:yes gene_type:complete